MSGKGYDLITVWALLRMASLIMLASVVVVTNVFSTHADILVYLMSALGYLGLGVYALHSTLTESRRISYIGIFLVVLALSYFVGVASAGGGFVAWIGNSLTVGGIIFYLGVLLFSLFIAYFGNRFFYEESGSDDGSEEG